jgi:bacteriocin biosynthesis cyclodehydratase domain-containing protein
MATTICLKRRRGPQLRRTCGLPEPVYVWTAGDFGAAVAQRLGRLRADIVANSVDDGTLPQVWPDARINVVVSSRPIPDFCELLDGLSYERQRPFLPLIVDCAGMSLGPLIVPGRGSCWSCWMARSRQHDPWASRRKELWKHYSEHRRAGPSGYLEPFTLMAAARISQTIAALDDQKALPGHVWEMNMLTREVTNSRVAGVHGCRRCGLGREPGTRSIAEIQQRLGYLWAGVSGSQEQG